MSELFDPLNQSQIDLFRAIDTPTLCNAIEALGIRGRLDGTFGMDTRCLLPDLGVLFGHAITVLVDASTEGVHPDPEPWEAWLHAMESGPRPSVLVFKDVGPQPRRAAHFGEQMATLARRFGVLGIVTDGGLRDIQQLEAMGFHCFGPGVVASHGNPRLLDVGVPVQIDGVTVRPGDLLHGDANGLTTFPAELAAQVLEATQRALDLDRRCIAYFAGPRFSIEGVMRLYRGDRSVL